MDQVQLKPRPTKANTSKAIVKADTSAQVPSASEFRLNQLSASCHAGWCMQAGVVVACTLPTVYQGLTGAKVWQEAMYETAYVLAYLLVFSVPALVLLAGKKTWLPRACATSHLVRTCAVTSVALGVAPMSEAMRTLLEMHCELLIEILILFTDQLSLPVMACLHALRHVAWMSVYVAVMGGTYRAAVLRGCFNYTVVMCLSYAMAQRLQANYRKLLARSAFPQPHLQAAPGVTPTMDSDALKKGQALCGGGAAGGSGSGLCDKTRSHRKSASSLQADAQAQAPHVSDELPVAGTADDAPEPTDQTAPAQVEALPDRSATASGSETDLTVHVRSVTARMAAWTAPREPVAVAAAEAVPGGAPATAAGGDPGCLLGPGSAVAGILARRQAKPYMSNRQLLRKPVYMKIEGIDLENLSDDFGKAFEEETKQSLPGVCLAGLALRSGCVSLTLDYLPTEECEAQSESDAASVDVTARVREGLARLALKQAWPATHGTIQMEGGDILSFAWNQDSATYEEIDPTELVTDLQPLLEQCHLTHVTPHVACLLATTSTSGAAGSSLPVAGPQLVRFQAQLLAPKMVPLLGAKAASVTDDVCVEQLLDSPVGAEDVPCERDLEGLGMKVLLRHVLGGYLPATVETLGMTESVVQDQVVCSWHVEVTAPVDASCLGGLFLEVWLVLPPVSPAPPAASGDAPPLRPPHVELIAADAPVLLLPAERSDAAMQLQDHVNALRRGGRGHFGLNSGMEGLFDSAEELLGQLYPASSPAATTAGSPADPDMVDDLDRVLALVEDFGVCLAHFLNPQTNYLAINSPLEVVLLERMDGLLVYAVQQGLAGVAGLLAQLLQAVETRETSGVRRRGASGWLMRAAWRLSATGDDDGVQEDIEEEVRGSAVTRQQSHVSLLHAAMMSGQPATLQQVLGWASLYGGGGWRWSWRLEDEVGCTALHLVAALPPPACAAMIDVLEQLLPASELAAMKESWWGCRGGLQLTPAQVQRAVLDALMARTLPAAAAPHEPAAASMQAPVPPAPGAVPASSTQLVAGAGTSQATMLATAACASPAKEAWAAAHVSVADGSSSSAWLSGSCEPAGCSGKTNGVPAAAKNVNGGTSSALTQRGSCDSDVAAASALPGGAAGAGRPMTVWQSIKGVWSVEGSLASKDWTLRKMTPVFNCWAICHMLTTSSALWRSYETHTLRSEFVHVALHGVCYLPVAVITMLCGRGSPKLRNAQVWMLAARLCDSLGFFLKRTIPRKDLTTWYVSAHSAADWFYSLLMVGVLDQTPLPWLLAIRCLEAYCQYLAYQAVDMPNALQRALTVQALGLLITTVSQAQQLRAYDRWRRSLVASQQTQEVQGQCPGADKPVWDKEGSHAKKTQ